MNKEKGFITAVFWAPVSLILIGIMLYMLAIFLSPNHCVSRITHEDGVITLSDVCTSQ